MRGKSICKTLKEVRLTVARENDIDYQPIECHHQGPCRGTCPACEAEVRYLEQQLSLRQRLGKAVAVAGVTLSALNMHAQGTAPSDQTASTSGQKDANSTLQKELPVKSLLKPGEQGIIWRGQVIDKDGDPIIGASVMRTDIPKNDKMGAVTDIDGCFGVEVPVGAELTIFYIGMHDVVMTVSNDPPALITVEMEEEETTGIVVIAGGVDRFSYDDVYGRCRKK